MRLIDADALSEKLCETTIFIKDGEVFQRMINDAPTVSAEAEQVTGKLKKPCNSLLKADSDECKEQKSKLDLISRADAIDAVFDTEPFVMMDGKHLNRSTVFQKTSDVIDALSALPSAEAVDVVRCKDCKHRDPEDQKCDCGHDIMWQLPREDDWFCCDGMRKDGESDE